MNRNLIAIVAVVFLLGILSLTGHAEQAKEDKGAAGKNQMQMSPEVMQKMMQNPETIQQMMLIMMKNMGMSDNMMSQCMNMMRTPIFPDSPFSIFALKQQLGLTEEQMKKLGSIEEKARSEARKVLTEEQTKKFSELVKNWKPMSMMEGMQTMMPEMQKKMGGQQMPCPCPMCQQMMP